MEAKGRTHLPHSKRDLSTFGLWLGQASLYLISIKVMKPSKEHHETLRKPGVIVMAPLVSQEDRSSEAKSFALRRKEMVERNIAARGVRDELVLEAMRNVPREFFLPTRLREFAYDDTAPCPLKKDRQSLNPISSRS